jgi:hypothetical protein
VTNSFVLSRLLLWWRGKYSKQVSYIGDIWQVDGVIQGWNRVGEAVAATS